jgi:redox-sensitive bicupin YhaK (pirin superfamily)
MTYLFEGEILHRDSLGTVQPIRPGAINWMTAGRGIAHSERTLAETTAAGVLSGIQFWVALPKSHEEMDPAFLHLEAGDLPVLTDRQVSVRVIAGDAFGRSSPLRAPHPMLCLDVALAKGATWELPADYPERALYVATGELEISGATHRQGQLLVFPARQLAAIRAISDARLILPSQWTAQDISGGTSSRVPRIGLKRPSSIGSWVDLQVFPAKPTSFRSLNKVFVDPDAS